MGLHTFIGHYQGKRRGSHDGERTYEVLRGDVEKTQSQASNDSEIFQPASR